MMRDCYPQRHSRARVMLVFGHISYIGINTSTNITNMIDKLTTHARTVLSQHPPWATRRYLANRGGIWRTWLDAFFRNGITI